MQLDLTTIIPCRSPSAVKAADLQAELRKLKPDAEITNVLDSAGSVHGTGAGQGLLFKMDGLSMAAVSMNVPLPIDALVYGPSPSFFWMTAAKDLAANTCHMRVFITEPIASRDALLRAARAQTLVTAAVCKIIPAMGVLWCAANNLLPLDRFLNAAGAFAQDGQAPAEIWVRLMASNTKDGMVVATHGLASYAGREVEFAPTHKFDFGTLGARVMQIAQYLIESGKALKGGEVIAPEQFRIELREKGSFDSRPVYVLKTE